LVRRFAAPRPSSGCRFAGRVLVVLLAVGLAAGAAVMGGCAGEVALGPDAAGEPAGNPRPVRLRLTIAADPVHAALAEVYAAQFEAVGVEVVVDVRSHAEITRPGASGEWDAIVAGWWSPTPDPLGMTVAKLSSGGAENFSGYADAEADRLLARLALEPWPEEKEELAHTLQEYVHEAAPWVAGVAAPLYDAARDGLEGWRPGPGGAVSLHDALPPAGRDYIEVALGAFPGPCLDPFRPMDAQVGAVFRCLFDGLTTRTPEGTLVPELAEQWSFAPTARKLVVRLREGVAFHSGEPLRPTDVVFTYRRFLQGRLPPGVKVRLQEAGDRDVIFSFSTPFPSFLDLFGQVPVVPAGYYESVGPDGFSEAPVGTGPFRYEGVRGGALVLSRWEGYYGGARALPPAGPAPAPEVRFRFLPGDERRLEALTRGQVDLAPALAALAVEMRFPPPPEGLGLVVSREPGWYATVLELDVTEPPLDDARVRVALNLALDPEVLLAAAGAEARIQPGGFPAEGFGFTTENTVFEPDVEAAHALLSEAGYLVGEP